MKQLFRKNHTGCGSKKNVNSFSQSLILWNIKINYKWKGYNLYIKLTNIWEEEFYLLINKMNS